MSFSLFEPPVLVTPGEYFVSSHEHYRQTPFNARWHHDVKTVLEHSYHAESRGGSPDPHSHSSYSRSPSPSPSSIFDSPYHSPMSTPPSSPEPTPHYDDSIITTNLPSRFARSVAERRKTYRRAVVAEATVSQQKVLAEKTAKLREKKTKSASAPALAHTSAYKGRRSSVLCRWGGCGHRIADSKDLWAHVQYVHNPLKDHLNDGPEAGEVAMDEEDEVAYDDEDYDDQEWTESSSRQAGSSSSPPKHQRMVRCCWVGCKTSIQFAGIKRHVESKHSGVRDTPCPKGCGYTTNRPDMMYRHIDHWHTEPTTTSSKGKGKLV